MQLISCHRNAVMLQQEGIDLSIYSQRDLDRIAHSLNTRPRAVLGFQTPEEVFMIELSKLGDALQI